MKRLAAILLVVVFLFNFTGFYIYFVFRLAEIRREMHSLLKTLPESQLKLFTLTEAEFARVRMGDDEIKVNGKMHDIARVVRSQGQLRVYAVHDEAEDNLLSFLDEVLKRAGRDKKPLPQNIFHTFNACLSPYGLSLANSFSHVTHLTFYKAEATEAFVRVFSPPPKV